MAQITLAGESLIAQKQGAKQALRITHFIYANVPGLDPQKPIDRAAAKPPAEQIVHTYGIPEENIGYVNPNQVVYSSMLGSDIGDFDWNWLGLASEEGVLFAVAYLPLQQKRRNIPPIQIGNNITRNILVEYSGAQELTGITIDASTWQHDFTVRLAGIDERERLSNREVYGRACFFNGALQVIGTPAAGYQVKAGTAYVEGIRLDTKATPITPPATPTTAWLDVALERQLNDVAARWEVVFGGPDALSDWTDALGVQHYRVPLADLSPSALVDRRGTEVIDGPLIKHFASARSVAQVSKRVSDLEDGTTPAGRANKWAAARRIAFQGDATGQSDVDGSINVGIRLTLANVGVTPGAWAKPVVNAKGLVVGNELLVPGDIPALDWSKITSGKPTTLKGYGITDALHTGYSSQVPRFYSPVPGTGYQTIALEIREAELVMEESKEWEYAPRIGFHWGGVSAGTLGMTATGELCWNSNLIWHEGNLNPELLLPVGSRVTSFSASPPPGCLRTNGAAVSRTAYARLFAEIGSRYGAGDGTSTFNLPDTRGLFIRDMDDGRGTDPGRAFGSVQFSQNLSHNHYAVTGENGAHHHPGSSVTVGEAGSHPHTLRMGTHDVAGHHPNLVAPGGGAVQSMQVVDWGGAHAHSGHLAMAWDGVHAHTVTVDPSGGTESRPVNMAIYNYIKY